MTEKLKNDAVLRKPASQRTGALILIAIGILFLLINSGLFSFSDIGEFFGSFGRIIGEFFGNLGRSIGEFFGNFGRSMGEFFGGLGRSIANVWPLVLILIGIALLFWRRPSRQEEK
jgi:hypothetical protein